MLGSVGNIWRELRVPVTGVGSAFEPSPIRDVDGTTRSSAGTANGPKTMIFGSVLEGWE